MEKNTFSTKKRVTHIGNNPHEEFDGLSTNGFDVISLIEQMDNYSSASMEKCSELFKNKNNERLNISKIDKVQSSAATSSNSNSVAERSAASKLKKFVIARKFPLMEKSQKTLKHLKHNRSIPKPRAHVASFILTPIRTELGTEASNFLQSKKKLHKQKNKIVRKKIVTPVTKPYLQVVSRSSKNRMSNVKQSFSKTLNTNNKQAVVKHDKFKTNIIGLENNVPLKTSSKIDISNDDTTDSEYERFIQNNKIGLEEEEAPPKKARKKAVKKKKMLPKRKSKRLNDCNSLVGTLEQYNSNFHDDSSNDPPQRKSKRLKKCSVLESISEHSNSKFYDSSDDHPKRKPESLKKCSSLESIPEQYSSNFHDDSSDDDQSISTKTTEVGFNATFDSSHETISFQHSSIENSSNLKSVNNFEPILQEDDASCIDGSRLIESKILSTESFKIQENEILEVINNPNLDIFSKANDTFITDSNVKVNIIKNDHFAKSLEHSLETRNAECELSSGCDSSVNKYPLQSVNSQNMSDQAHSINAETIDLCSSDSEAESIEHGHLFGSSTRQNQGSEGRLVQKYEKALLSVTLDSEECDVEIIEVVPQPNQKQIPDCKQCICNLDYKNSPAVATIHHKAEEVSADSHTKSDMEFSLTSVITTVKNIAERVIKPIALTNIVKDTPTPVVACFNVKKEIVEKVVKKEVVYEPKTVKKEVVESNNPVYMTNICKGYNENEAGSDVINHHSKNSVPATSNSLKQYQCNKDDDDDIMIIESDTKCQFQPILNQILKQEPQENDDIIIDFISIKKEPVADNIFISPDQNACSKIKIENSQLTIKTECSASSSKIPKFVDMKDTLRENSLALCGVDSPGTKPFITETWPIEFFKSHKVKPLLEAYKKEFNTYRELVNTEASLEASLKFIEKQQAEKLNSIRSLIHDLVKNDPNFYNLCTDAVLGNISQSSLNSSSFENLSGSKIQRSSIQSRQEINSGNMLSQISSSVPLLSIKTEDDKIDVSKLNLQHSFAIENSVKIKSESPENIQMQEGKKCDVCGKQALAACQRCAKAFFCSDECGKQFWNNGHEDICGK